MHPITSHDKGVLFKYNVKNNALRLIKSIKNQQRNKNHLSWVNGKKVLLRKGKTDILVFKKIFIDREYDFKLTHKIETIIDAGANIGLSAIFFATKFPNATIIAIEPELSNFKLLQANVAPYPNIRPLFGGINNESGTFIIKNTSGDHWNFMLEKNPGEQVGDGSFYTMEEIMSKFNFSTIDFLKIDIEGGEQALFQNNYSWLNKVKALSIELHDFILPASSNPFFKAIVQHEPYNHFTYGENHLVVFSNH